MLKSWSKRRETFTMPRFQQGDLTLVPMQEAHAEALFAIIERDRDHLRRWQNWPDTIRTLDDMQDLIQISNMKSRNRQGYDLVIVHRGAVAGKIGLVYVDWEYGFAEIGYWLGRRFVGRGLMTRATWFITGHAICRHDLPTIYIRSATENAASRAIPERLGFHFDGVQEKRMYIRGELHDNALYSMTATRWYSAMIYHITTQAEWKRAAQTGEYRAESLDTQGFIHASKRDQIVKVADAIYSGRDDLLLLCIDPARLESPLRHEPPDPSIPAEHYDGELFPHLYGALNIDAVLQVVPFPPNAYGTFTLPDAIE